MEDLEKAAELDLRSKGVPGQTVSNELPSGNIEDDLSYGKGKVPNFIAGCESKVRENIVNNYFLELKKFPIFQCLNLSIFGITIFNKRTPSQNGDH